jgi:hypothetical protein
MRLNTLMTTLLLSLAATPAMAEYHERPGNPGTQRDEPSWFDGPGSGLKKAGVAIGVFGLVHTAMGAGFLVAASDYEDPCDDHGSDDESPDGFCIDINTDAIMGWGFLIPGLVGDLTGAIVTLAGIDKANNAVALEPYVVPHLPVDRMSPVAVDGAVLGLKGTF